MSVGTSAPARRRRTIAAAVSAALAFAGLAVATPVAEAAANPSISITPGSVTPDAASTLTLTISGGASGPVGSARISVPSGWTAVGIGTTPPSPWTATVSGSVITFDTNANNTKIADGQSVSFTVNGHSPTTTGGQTWTMSYYANSGANGNNPAQTSTTVTVGNPAQTITFGALSNKTYGDAPFTVAAVGGASGQPVTFTASGTCASGGDNGATITMTGAGSCSVTANQAAGNGYQAASPVTQSFRIDKAGQTISFPGISTPTYGDADLSLSATATSGLPVSFTASGSCSVVAGPKLRFDAAGLCTVNADQAGNGNYNAAPQQTQSFTVNKADGHVSLSGLAYTYDGDPHGATVTTTPDGLGTITVTYDGGSALPRRAGSYAVVASLDNRDYSGSTTGTLVIGRKHITGDFTVQGRQYDSTTDATVLTRTLVDAVSGDDVSLVGGTATFDSKDVGSRTATLSGADLAGSAKANYFLDGVETTTATIAKAPVIATIMAGDKDYDGNATAAIQDKSIGYVFPGDDLDLTATDAHFGDADAGMDKDVSATIELTGDDKDNYDLTNTTAHTTATINRVVLLGSFTANDKVYDGGTDATVKATSLPGVVGSEDVTLVVGSPHFADKNVGPGKTVTGTLSLGGTATLDNYVLSSASDNTATADITAASLRGSVSADDKVYDRTTDAIAHPAGLDGVLGDDAVSLVVDSASFGTKNVGNGKTVTADLGLTGAEASNYSVNPTAIALANITAKPLTATITADDKSYDGNRTAVTHPSLAGVIEGDTVAIHSVGLFDNKNVGTDKTVTADITIDGADAGNYTVNHSAGTTADITAATLITSITAADKVYDGNDAAEVTGSIDSGIADGDVVSIDTATGRFDSADAGDNRTVTGTLTLKGADAGNYTFNAHPTASANIAKRPVTGSFTADNKVYDGSAGATVLTQGLSNTVAADSGNVGVDVTDARFSDANVGPRTVTGTFTLTGPRAGNYELTSPTGTTSASITKRPVIGSFTVANKVYDGATNATVTSKPLTNTVAGDTVELTVTGAHFDNKNVGNGKTVTGTLGLTGDPNGNYELSYLSPSTTTANITKRPVTGSFTADNKVYDGTTGAIILTRSLTPAAEGSSTGKLAGDQVSLSGGTATFANKQADTGKTVTGTGFTLTGTDAGNYDLGTVASTTANITKRDVGGSFTVLDKVWDGTTTATINNRYLNGASGITGKISSDDLSLSGGTATFSSPNVGGPWTVTGTGFDLAGAEAGNYHLTGVATTSASITSYYFGTGFYKPVDQTPAGGVRVWNTVKGGQTVPLKFNVKDAGSVNQTSLSIFGADATAQAKAFSAQRIDCSSEASINDPVDFITTGATSLRYDGTAGQFIQNWKTPTTAGNCYLVTVQTLDGSVAGSGYFKITK